jgi:hypothetical protein
MAEESRNRGSLRRITVINLDSLSDKDYLLLEALFGPREAWPVFQWDVLDAEWQRETLNPLSARSR